MQTHLSEQARALPRSDEAQAILRSCVHCGFCNATCPTYQLLGDELDGPRGRIYLIKQVLEGQPPSASTRLHLDRCLSCRSCESTCPSGVDYHHLLDIGRAAVEQAVPRPLGERLMRGALRAVLPRPALFHALLRTGQALRPWLPSRLQDTLAAGVHPHGQRPPTRHAHQVMLLEGCVQPSLSPNTNAATARVLDRMGISTVAVKNAGCCGALDYHLNAQDAGLQRARRNIDAWWPHVEAGARALVITASGCGAFVKDYGHLLAADSAYAQRAARISELACDLVEILREAPLQPLGMAANLKLAFHCPCTLQHAQRLGGAVEQVLTRLGFDLTAVPDAHLCCGSAGTYALTQPTLSRQLRDHKLNALESGQPEVIVTANIGCQSHLNGAGRTPVRHWIEMVDQAMSAADASDRF